MGTDEINDLRAENAELEAEVERLNNKLNQDSQTFQIGCLKAEVERLKAHTWQQERAAVSRWLWSSGNGGVAMPIERGEHWPICGKSDDGD